MSILVTGGAGYIGSIVVERLLAAGEQVVVIDDLSEGHRAALDAEVHFVQGSIGDKALVAGVLRQHGVRAVVHMAAKAVIARSMTDPALFFNGNVVDGIHLLDAMREAGVHRMVFSSTAALFGEPVEVPISEQHHTAPINAYGASKLMFEDVLRWYSRAYGLKYVAFRYFNAAGASERHGEDHHPETHLIPLVLRVAFGQEPAVKVFGTDYPTRDGSCIRDYIHVLDLADAHLRALERLDSMESSCFNLGSGTGYSVLEVIEAARQVTRHPIPVVAAERRPGDPAVLVASSQRASAQLAWHATRQDLESIIASAWQWRLKHPHGYGAAAAIHS
jgi:UDP-glucose-4-epimerase GalE